MRLLWNILVLAAVLIGVGLATVWYQVTGTPHYSLYRLSEAIHFHDTDGAERYIDIDRIADDATETVVNSALAKQGTQENLSLLEQFGQDIAKGAVSLMLPTVKAKLREDLRIGVTRMIEGEQQGDSILSPPSGAIEAYKAFKISRDRKVAYVRYDDPKQGLIKFKMVQRSDRRWKVVAFDREWVINWAHDAPVRNIKAGKITEIKADQWLVEVGCLGYAQGAERCQPEPQYRWLKSLRDHHPKFIAYSEHWMPKDLEQWTPKDLSKIDKKEMLELAEWLRQSGLIVYQVVDRLRPDIFLQYAGAYVGPFGSEKDVKTWIKWAESLGSLPDGYDFSHPRRIIKYVSALEPEEKLLSPPKKIEGVVTRVADERGGLLFWLNKDKGGEVSFSIESALAYAPRNKDKGRRYLVEYRDITYKRAGKVVSEGREVLELRDIDPRKREQDVCRIQLDVFQDEKKATGFMKRLGKEHYGAFLATQEKDGQRYYLVCIPTLSREEAQQMYGDLKLKERFPRITIVAGEEKKDKSN